MTVNNPQYKAIWKALSFLFVSESLFVSFVSRFTAVIPKNLIRISLLSPLDLLLNSYFTNMLYKINFFESVWINWSIWYAAYPIKFSTLILKLNSMTLFLKMKRPKWTQKWVLLQFWPSTFTTLFEKTTTLWYIAWFNGNEECIGIQLNEKMSEPPCQSQGYLANAPDCIPCLFTIMLKFILMRLRKKVPYLYTLDNL